MTPKMMMVGHHVHPDVDSPDHVYDVLWCTSDILCYFQ